MDSLRPSSELRDSVVERDSDDPGILAAEWLTGIKLDDEHLESLTRVIVASGQGADLFEGHFDLDAVRARLREQNCEQDEYQGVELWRFGEIACAALTEEVVLVGVYGEDGVRDCIDVMKGQKKSLRSSGDLKVVVDKLPTEVYGLIVQTEEEESQDVVAWGSAITKMDADTLKRTEVYRFKDEQTAVDKMDEVKASIDQDPDWFTLTVDQKKEFVEATAWMRTEDFISSTG
jgi:hypothetical protein